MIKLYALLVMRDGMSPVDFHAHWREVHGPLAAKIRRANAYVQCHRLPWQPEDLPVLPHGGSAEVWFEDFASAEALMTDPDYTENAGQDEDNFHHMDRMTALHTTQRTLLEGTPMARETGGVKVMQFVRRAQGIEREEFRRLWLGERGGDAAGTALGLLRHVRAAAIPETDDVADARFDGVRELWWPDAWCFMAARAQTPSAWEHLIADPAIDPAGSGFLVTTEHRVVWPPHE